MKNYFLVPKTFHEGYCNPLDTGPQVTSRNTLKIDFWIVKKVKELTT